MSQNNRNAGRERKGGAPKRYESDERRYNSNQSESRDRNISRVHVERMSLSRERENDLYERQSI